MTTRKEEESKQNKTKVLSHDLWTCTYAIKILHKYYVKTQIIIHVLQSHLTPANIDISQNTTHSEIPLKTMKGKTQRLTFTIGFFNIYF